MEVESDESKVIKDQAVFELEGFSLGHEFWSGPHSEEVETGQSPCRCVALH